MKNGKSCYVEINSHAAAWLTNLVARGVIAPGDVMCCSVTDIRPADLASYSQVHLYAGIGVHSYALRRAGIPDTANVWTFSEPCQPFSDAGKGLGFADERYLRPYTHHLIEQCRPSICLGEQVASNDGLGWLDIVQADFERAGYACGAQDTCSAGYGAPHIRQRLRVCAVAEEWMADATGNGRIGRWSSQESDGRGSPRIEPQRLCNADVLVHPISAGLEGLGGHGDDGDQSGRLGTVPYRSIAAASGVSGMADAHGDATGRNTGTTHSTQNEIHESNSCDGDRFGDGSLIGHNSRIRPGPVNGFWRDADWLYCRDARWRPVESGTFPLAHGASSRVGRLRGYGNAIDAEATTAFYREVGEVLGLN